MSTTEPSAHPPGSKSWAEVHASEDFQRLRSRLRRFVFPMTALFLVWYLTYVVVADYAHDFMSIKVIGNINVGLIFGLLQFVSTFAITALYIRYANRKLDPIADRIKEDMEGGAS
ncbi:DUF485 domain-containing protein [Saccharomonospora sp.]|uniref:DUF485 domain-containing protein n=1 Tax=Saccharomonospora sp. TaxID=33913 RepID=UPI0026157130|nr:DUF485 domain-containing protein [Saccharomonospora sp.]